MLDRQPLCLAFEENFDDPATVFGQVGTKGGSFMREVNMDGFGLVFSSLPFHVFSFDIDSRTCQKRRIRNGHGFYE